ncbi:MAG: hypothetical protein HYZ28_12765 [Myxococcales bacterium]|nr:hypothetical protein [Myxococcales bacterium]
MTPKKPFGDLAKAVARARELRPALDKATEELNSVLREVEAVLAGFKLGVNLSVVVSEADDGLSRVTLELAKWGGEWRLLRVYSREGEPEEVTPLLNASRENRIEAVEWLTTLLQDAVAAVERETKRVQESTARAREFLNGLAETKQ